MNILERICCQEDLVALSDHEREILCQQIRDFLVLHVSKTGGHLASNLGVVELTVAIETVFNTAKDRLVFDVGHQSYVHKLLTGRQADFDCLRQFGGIAGFPKPSESNTDAFVAGHASSSVSIALGMARARTLLGEDYNVVALLGDGAATGGIAYEGLNDAAVSKEPLVIILNDNAMSIDHNVGGMAYHLAQIRTKERYLGLKERYRTFTRKIPGGKQIFRITRDVKEAVRRALLPSTIFESMGFDYLGPVDGHDLPGLIALLKIAKDMMRPVVVHVLTQKGRGYIPAENHPEIFHGVGKFDAESGKMISKHAETFSEVFGAALCDLALENNKVCAVTAAMPSGTGLLPFKATFPDRLFDVGIAEEHAVSMAGGLAKQGMIPIFAVYSTFLQRAYDLILQDIAMLRLHVVLAIDRAGLVGEDGETHHGVFDVGFLRQVPGMAILCPASTRELKEMLNWAVREHNGPVAIRYPRGGNRDYSDSAWCDETNPSCNGAVACHRFGAKVALITYGTILQNVTEAAEQLEKQGMEPTILRLLTVSPLPVEKIVASIQNCTHVFIVEETCKGSGIGEALALQLMQRKPECRAYAIDLGQRFVPHGNLSTLYKYCGLDADSIAARVLEVLKVEE